MSRRPTTSQEHQTRINEALYRIHADLAGELDINTLARRACYSPYHFQRIFRQVTGESVHDYVRRARLEWAANLLVYNPEAPITEVAESCGFRSGSSFNHAFHGSFHCSPSQWRKEEFERRSRQLKTDWAVSEANPHRAYHLATLAGEETAGMLEVQLQRLKPQRVVALRHVGYDRGIRSVWLRLLDWAERHGIDPERQTMIGLHHGNPDLIPFDRCRYVACLTLPEGVEPRGMGVMEIPGGLHACCEAEGGFGDLLYLMHNLYRHWLPESDYQARSLPPMALYAENHFINQSGRFRLQFCIPVQFERGAGRW